MLAPRTRCSGRRCATPRPPGARPTTSEASTPRWGPRAPSPGCCSSSSAPAPTSSRWWGSASSSSAGSGTSPSPGPWLPASRSTSAATALAPRRTAPTSELPPPSPPSDVEVGADGAGRKVLPLLRRDDDPVDDDAARHRAGDPGPRGVTDPDPEAEVVVVRRPRVDGCLEGERCRLGGVVVSEVSRVREGHLDAGALLG